MSSCVFCDIAAKTVKTAILFENEKVVAFRDAHPVAPTHVLVVPKVHVAGAHDAGAETLGQVLAAACEVAERLDLNSSGYRLVINQGAHGGQTVLHLHCHVLGGRPLGWPPC